MDNFWERVQEETEERLGKRPEKPKPSTGHIYCEGCHQHPSKCNCWWFRIIITVLLVLLLLMFMGVTGLRAWIGYQEGQERKDAQQHQSSPLEEE